jgi:flavin reductase ActVB
MQQPQPTPPGDAVSEAFRAAMSRLATGVVMVTCHVDDKPWGLTISACCSVSMEPPLLLVSLRRPTASAQAIALTERFGVSVLGESLIDVARFGSASGRPKFVHDYCRDAGDPDCRSASPVVAGALAHVDCTLEQVVAAGDHDLFIGRVQGVVLGAADAPLVYSARSFHRLEPSAALSA